MNDLLGILGIIFTAIGLALSCVAIFGNVPRFASEERLIALGKWSEIDGEPMNRFAEEFDRRNSGLTMTNDQRKQTIRQVKSMLAVTSNPAMLFNSSPRAHRATLWAVPAVALGLITSHLVIAICVAAAIFVVVWKITPAETWNERFYKLMTAYQPLDEGAYQVLLTKIKANTGIRDDIRAWLSVEIAQVERPTEVAAEKALLDSRLH